MKNLLLTIALIVNIVNNLCSQDYYDAKWIAIDTNAFQIATIAYWQANESKDYYSQHKKYKFNKDSVVEERLISSSQVSFVIQDSAESSYTLNYVYKDDLKDSANYDDFNFDALIGVVDEENFKLIYKTDELGTISSYDNLDEYMNNLDLIIGHVKFKLKGENENQNKILDHLVNKNTFYDAFCGVFVSNFHFVHGMQMGIDDTLYYKQHNGVMEEECYLFISYYDTLTREVGYTIEQYGDSEALKTYMYSKLKDFGNHVELENLSVSSFIKKYLYIDLNTGWPTFLQVIKEITQYNELTEEEVTHQDVWVLSIDPIEK
ncbi:MAG TPA: hypothetical protein PKD85_13600 [Saprospiraceae bacterium]|nr:hypothetical protein [Saprospiraceae bacterium]